MRVLLVDDEINALEVLQDAVKELMDGQEINAFNSSSKALEFSKDNPPDIAFLDIQMPGITGIELAKQLKGINSKVNIIFSTGYSEYASTAFNMRASGYLMKPISVRDVKQELDNLRNPIMEETDRIIINTFGEFDVRVDGKTVKFSRKPAKEFLAYLVDRKGVSVPRRELVKILLNDNEYTRKSQNYLTKIAKDLYDSLKAVNAQSIISINGDSYNVNIDKFRCDAYDYLSGNPTAFNMFCGEYMTQYPWAMRSLVQFTK